MNLLKNNGVAPNTALSNDDIGFLKSKLAANESAKGNTGGMANWEMRKQSSN